MGIFDKIYNDKEIRDRYLEVEKYEDLNNGRAYHNFSHVNNVVGTVEVLFKDLGYDDEMIERAKIAALLHDTGANIGKDGHAYRSYLYALEYLKKYNLDSDEDILEAIRIHSNGFDTDNMIALAIILADKLDVKSNRISDVGRKVIGNRQYQYVNDIGINIDNSKLVIDFIIEDGVDLIELEDYYFTTKIFNAIRSFCKRVDLVPVVLINNKKWDKFYEE